LGGLILAALEIVGGLVILAALMALADALFNRAPKRGGRR